MRISACGDRTMAPGGGPGAFFMVGRPTARSRLTGSSSFVEEERLQSTRNLNSSVESFKKFVNCQET